MSNLQRDWAYLFPEAIDMIVEKLDDSFPAFMSFISVCQHWRIVALEEKVDIKKKKKKKSDNMQKLEILRTCRNQLPLLVIETQVRTYQVSRCFFTAFPLDGNAGGGICCYQLKNQGDDLPPGPISYFGSCFGWLLAQRKLSSSLPMVDIALFNPLAGAVKYLPPRWSSSEDNNRRYIGDCYKGVLSSDPSCSKDGYELVVIHDEFRRLACYRSRTNSWIRVKLVGDHRRVVDVVFYRGKVYGVTDMGDLLQVDFDVSETTIRVVVAAGFDRIPLQAGCPNALVTHLVVPKHGQYLLMVEQIEVKYFKVYKLCCETWTWVEMINGLGGEQEALFVGCNNILWDRSCFSACVSTLEFPQCQPNCIYYTYGSHLWDKERRGIFNLELKQHFQMPLRLGGAGVGYSSTQIWMVPNFK